MEPSTGTAWRSQDTCWRCDTRLWRLEPPVQASWPYYCPACQHLTVTRAEAARALATIPKGAVGVVIAWPYPRRLVAAAPSPPP
jgi:hypothetical protein